MPEDHDVAEHHDVIVVGGGCAGLSAAHTLQEHGIDYVLLEADNRTGGRVGNRTVGPFTWAIGATMTEPQWDTTFRYLDEFDLLDRVQKVDSQCFGFWNGEQTRFLSVGRGMRLRNLRDFLTEGGLPARAYPQAARLAVALLPRMLKVLTSGTGDRQLPGLAGVEAATCEEFGLRHGGTEVTDRLLAPYIGTMLFGQLPDVSIAHPVAALSLMRGMRSIDGGMAVLTDRLYDQVRDHVRLSTPVEEVVIDDGAVRGVRTGEGIIEAADVICATDAHVTSRIIPDLPEAVAADLSSCTYSSTYNYVFGLDRRVVPDNFVSLMIPHSTDSLLVRVFDENSGAFGSRGPAGTSLIHAFTAGWYDGRLSAMTEDQRRAAVISELQRFIPDFPDEPSTTDVVRWDRAVCQQPPEHLAAMRDLRQHHWQDVEGLHLAGEYLFVVSSTEGVLLTGRQAALSVAADLGAPVAKPQP
ncbi:protoporphyrinogen/coproporphyrinogen oxidase [Acidipropionibacterium thoenii]|uniref:protoporphyrinogen/coproporphyrinogen oxidase n=1 Tax=Acidipropionibacterium thoenii TaxID=1751 RepID=UPI0004191D63|nr:NAD(P)/FAD-dependent oxidoreductase [Acidipropionibacterium thoenii]